MEELRMHFRPEFINRVDDIVVFHSLNKEHMKDVIKIQLERLKKRLNERKISLKISAKAIEFLTEYGFDPVYGARPLKRAIQKKLESPLARAILSGEVKERQNITAKLADGNFIFCIEALYLNLP